MGRVIAALTVALALVGSPLAAQQHGHGVSSDSGGAPMGMMQGQTGMMGGGMMQMMQMMQGQHGMMGGMLAGGPAMILQLRGSLDLTDDQVARLEALRDSARSEMRQQTHQGMQAIQAASRQLAPATTDLEAYATGLRQAAEHIIQAHIALARAGVEARSVLTEEQQGRLDILWRGFEELRGGTMNGGMMNGGTMQGGMGQGG